MAFNQSFKGSFVACSGVGCDRELKSAFTAGALVEARAGAPLVRAGVDLVSQAWSYEFIRQIHLGLAYCGFDAPLNHLIDLCHRRPNAMAPRWLSS